MQRRSGFDIRKQAERNKLKEKLAIEIVTYDNAKDLVLKYFRYERPKMKEVKLMNIHTEFTVVHNHRKIKDAKVKYVLDSVKKQGIWAFCRHVSKEKKEIHLWISNNKKLENYQIINVISHEVSHALGVKSEKVAVKYGGVASLAYLMMNRELKEYVRKSTTQRLKIAGFASSEDTIG